MKITDKYGNKVGTVEQHGDSFTVNNQYGNKIGSGDKQFLGNDYNIRDRYGDKVGKAEKDIFGDGYTVRDNDGNKVGRVTPKSSNVDFSGGGVIAIIVIVALLFFGAKMVPELLTDLFSTSDKENWLILGPAMVFIIVDFITIFYKKASVTTEHPIKQHLLHALSATAIDVVIILIWGWIDKADDSSMLDRIFEPIIIAIMIIPLTLVIFLPIGLVFGIIATVKNKISADQ